MVPGWTEQPGGIIAGKFDGNGSEVNPVGYILFSECSKPQAEAFDAALDSLMDTKAR